MSVLTRYLDPNVLGRIAGQRIEPRGLVLGNLAGSHKSPLAGFAVEFAGHREYVWGDDPKHIDWRVFYRRQRMFVKQYEMETNFVCHFILDISASMRYGEGEQQKLDYAAKAISALGYAVVHQSDKVSLATLDEEIRGIVPPGNSMPQIVRMAELLGRSEPLNKTRMPQCLSELAGRMKRREIVMIFSDFFTDLGALEAALQQMRYRRHEVVLFQIMHHDELAFEFQPMTKFIGLELPEELVAQPTEIRRAYLHAVERFNGEFETLCQRNGIERVLCDTSRNLADVLCDYLHQRSRLRRRR